MQKLLLATNNQGKIREMKSMLDDLPFKILTLDEIKFPSLSASIQETGKTFAENASIKAEAYATRTNLLTLADDSGLEIDALSGKPGIHSARFVEGSDKARCTKVLELLKKVTSRKRTARFKAAIAVSLPASKKTQIFEGISEGLITTKPLGQNGFGYDPIFYSKELRKTFAQAKPFEKNRVSHRARALRQAKLFLRKLSQSRA